MNEDLGLAWLNLRHVHELVGAALGHELEAETGIGLTEAYVLVRLAKAPSGCLRMGDLAARLDMAQSGVTRLIDRLEVRGWVVREQPRTNRRTTYARLTDAGRAQADRLRPAYVRVLGERLGAFLSEHDVAELRRLLRTVIEGLGGCEEASWACGSAEDVAPAGNRPARVPA